MVNEFMKKSNNKIWIIILFLLVMIGVGIGYYLLSKGNISTDDAYVDGHVYIVSPRVSGFITDVYVTDNEKVKKGHILVSLDPMQYEVALADAKASLAEAEATLTSLELGVPLELNQTEQRVNAARAGMTSLQESIEMAQKQEEAAEQELKRAQAENEIARLELRRIEELRKSNIVPQSALDKAKSLYDSTLAKVRSTEATWNSLKDHSNSLKAGMAREEANLGLAATGKDLAEIKVRQVNAQKAKVEMQRARVKQAELNLSYTKIPSPADGFITNKNVEPGLMVANGQHLMAVVPLATEEVWVTANYKETQLMHIHHGQPVKIKVDSYPGVEIKGRVDSIMAGTGAVFSLFPPENASGNFVKIVQRIPVKIDIEKDDNNDLPKLRIGMSVVPTIYTGN